MSQLLFGTAGTPHSARIKTTVGGIERIAELGLGCMEIEFVRGVKMSQESAHLVAETAAEKGIKLSTHAPYFIHFNARELEKIKASQYRLLQTARIGSLCGASSVAFHTAFYLSDPPEKAYEIIKRHLGEVLEQLKEGNIRVWIRPELMGKPSQFGSLKEVLELSAELEGVAPCIDFAHCHARTGKFNTYQEFDSILSQIEDRLGRDALNDMHIHVAGIEYGKKGEIRHLDLEDSDFQYVELLKALKDYEVKGLVICESPNLEGDALLLQTAYNNLPNAG